MITELRGRYAASRRLLRTFRGRYAQIFERVTLRGRYSAARRSVSALRGRYAVDGPELEQAPDGPLGPNNPGFGRSAEALAWQTGEGTLEILELTADGRDLRDAVPFVDLQLNESGPHSWSLTIPDQFAEYHPERVGGDWEGVMTDQADHLFKLRARWAGRILTFVGVPTDCAHQRVAKDGQRTLDLTWSGICYSWHLAREGVTQPTLRSSRAGLVRRDRVIREAAQAGGVDVVDLPSLPPLRLQHRQNYRPIDMIQQYCERDGLGYWFDGFKMRFFLRRLGSPSWTYGPRTMVESESSSMANPDLYSAVTVRRIVEAGDIAENPITCTTYGDQYSTSFSEPLNGVTWRPLAPPYRMVLSDFLFRNAAGTLVGVREQRGTIPYAPHLYTAPLIGITSVSWTAGNPTPGSLFTEGYAQVIFTGRTADTQIQDEFPAEFETSFSVPVTNPDLVAIVGPSRPKEMDVDETIGTQADATRVGNLHLERLLLDRGPRALSCPLNLGALPGQTIRVIDPILNRTQRGFLRTIRHRISYDPAECATVLEASGWRA